MKENKTTAKQRLYDIARYLCAGLFINVACLCFQVSFYFPAVPVIVALVAVVLGLMSPRRPAGRFQTLVCFFALVHLAIVGLWLHFILGYFGIMMNARFAAMVKDADRIVIRDGGGLCHSKLDMEPSLYEITNKTEIAEFNSMFQFSGTSLPCMCCGYPGVDWWRDGKRIVVSALHHGRALRVEGKGYNWRLATSSRQHIDKWLKEHCGVSCSNGGFPMYRQCACERYELQAEAQKFMQTHDGRRPTMGDVCVEIRNAGKSFPSCPVGGKYSLTFTEDGTAHVSCSVPFHE